MNTNEQQIDHEQVGTLDPSIRLAECEEQLAAITTAIKEYYSALDQKQHGGVAQDEAFSKIQNILGLRWQQ